MIKPKISKKYLSMRELFRVRNTVLEMLQVRGFIDNITMHYMPYNEFKTTYKRWKRFENIFDINITNKGARCYVHFHNTKFDKSRDGTLGFFKRILKLKTQDNLIIIFTNDNMPSDAEGYEEDSPLIQLYDAKHLIVNITKHKLVPHHRILTSAESSAVKARYNITQIQQFPIINNSDPVARFIGARLGDLIEIKRSDNFSGTHFHYRLVSFPQK